MEKKEGRGGQEIKSNVTDNESAMIQDSSGYLQGYIGIAVSDKKNQIIVNAVATGSANECPNGKTLGYKGTSVLRSKEGKRYQASVEDCRLCPHYSRCIRTKKDRGKWDRGRQILIMKSNEPGSLCGAMREKMR